MKKRNIFLSLALSLVFSINAHAALEVRGYGTFTADGVIYTEKLIYDSTLDITWLDFTRFHTVDGEYQNWYMQTNWANTLQVDFNGQTLDGWRLPQTLPVNGLAYNYDHSFDGSTDRGYNISALGSAFPGSTGSEMANLFYYTLGNDGAFDLDGNFRDIGDYGLKNTGPFENLLGYYYFSVTENTENTLLARQFDFDTGDQSNNFKTNTNCALAVRPGDVFPIPESLTVISPNGGEQLTAGDSHEITWTSEGEIDNIKIEYSANNGTDWMEIIASTENDGFYIWEVPCDLSDEILVGISDVDGDAYDESDGVFSIEDQDFDGDGTPDCIDNCPADPNKIDPGLCGCGTSDTDTDNDGTPDCNDGCLTDHNKTEPGVCGCGVPDTDSDVDGVADCNDGCPTDPNKIDPGLCGCGSPDTDTDSDGTPDCIDNCPNDPGKTESGICGCGIADTDSDGDGVAACNDCNDLDSSINPDACDIRKDGIDQDCDGFDRTRGKPCAAGGDDEEPSSKEGPAQTCNDGIDNDDDGYTDCDDSDCAKKKNCRI